MLYEVFSQGEPIRSSRKDHAGRHIFEANIVSLGKIDVPIGKCPIAYARDKFDLDHPMVSAVNGYTEDGKVHLSLQFESDAVIRQLCRDI